MNSSVITCLLATFYAGASASTAKEPVKVHILAGRSNMVGIGQVGPMEMSRFDTFLSDDPKAGKGSTFSIYEGGKN